MQPLLPIARAATAATNSNRRMASLPAGMSARPRRTDFQPPAASACSAAGAYGTNGFAGYIGGRGGKLESIPQSGEIPGRAAKDTDINVRANMSCPRRTGLYQVFWALAG